MLKLGWKKPTDRVVKRPTISDNYWEIFQDGDVNERDRQISKFTNGVWRNPLNRRANRLNKYDYWEAD